MFKKIIMTAIIATGLLASAQSMAAPYHHNAAFRIDSAQAKQAQLIERGVRSGELTSHEEHKLKEEQRLIKATEYRYRKHGLNSIEVKTLKNMLNRAERNIWREMTDNDRVSRHHDQHRGHDSDKRVSNDVRHDHQRTEQQNTERHLNDFEFDQAVISSTKVIKR